MIKSPKQRSKREILTARLAAVRAEIKLYAEPSPLGDRHDAHVRARWDAHIDALRRSEADLRQQIEGLA